MNMHGKDLFDIKSKFEEYSVVMSDRFDKWVYVVTSTVLVFLVLYSTGINYIGTEFLCATPTYLKSQQFVVDYYDLYCWTHGVIPIRNYKEIPQKKEGHEKLMNSRTIRMSNNFFSFGSVHDCTL